MKKLMIGILLVIAWLVVFYLGMAAETINQAKDVVKAHKDFLESKASNARNKNLIAYEAIVMRVVHENGYNTIHCYDMWKSKNFHLDLPTDYVFKLGYELVVYDGYAYAETPEETAMFIEKVSE